MRKNLFKLLASIGCITLLSLSAEAAIYKCVSAKNKVYYIDRPCPKMDQETQFKAVKDPAKGYIPPAFVEEKVDKAKEGVVVGHQDLSNPSSKQDKNSSNDVNVKKGGGNSGTTSTKVAPSSGAGNVVSSESKSSNSGNKSESLAENDMGDVEYDGLEPANVDDLIPATEAAAQNLN